MAETEAPQTPATETSPAKRTEIETSPAKDTEIETSPPEETEIEASPAKDTEIETSPPEETEIEASPANETKESKEEVAAEEATEGTPPVNASEGDVIVAMANDLKRKRENEGSIGDETEENGEGEGEAKRQRVEADEVNGSGENDVEESREGQAQAIENREHTTTGEDRTKLDQEDSEQRNNPSAETEPTDPTLTMTRTIEVPNNKVGVLIGKAGDTIRNLQINSGAKIQVVRDSEADLESSTRPVELSGSLESIGKAEQLIKAVIAEAEAGGSPALVARGFGTVQSGAEQIEIQVPNDKVGLVIGKGGETIKTLQTRSGARIQLIPQHLAEGEVAKERTVRVSGNKYQIETAREMIKDVINQTARPAASNQGQHNNYRSRGQGGPQWGSRSSQSHGPHYQQQRGSGGMYHNSSYNMQQQQQQPPQNQQYSNYQQAPPARPTPLLPIPQSYGHPATYPQAASGYGQPPPPQQQFYGQQMPAQQGFQPGYQGQQQQQYQQYYGGLANQGQALPAQQPYQYGPGSVPVQQNLAYGQTYGQQYMQQGGQVAPGYNQMGQQPVQPGGGYGQQQYQMTQPGYTNQQGNVNYGYQGGPGDGSSVYGTAPVVSGGLAGYAQPVQSQAGFDPSSVQQGVAQTGYPGSVPQLGYAKGVSPQPGYGGQWQT